MASDLFSSFFGHSTATLDFSPDASSSSSELEPTTAESEIFQDQADGGDVNNNVSASVLENDGSLSSGNPNVIDNSISSGLVDTANTVFGNPDRVGDSISNDLVNSANSAFTEPEQVGDSISSGLVNSVNRVFSEPEQVGNSISSDLVDTVNDIFSSQGESLQVNHNEYFVADADQVVKVGDSNQLINEQSRARLDEIGLTAQQIASFDAQAYLDMYPDLEANGVELGEALHHYLIFGSTPEENRVFTTV